MNKIKDNATANLKGFVVIKKDGKVVRAQHNLIVKTGRQFIYDITENNGFFSPDSTGDYANYKFYKLYAEKASGKSVMTTDDMELTDVSSRVSDTGKNIFEINKKQSVIINGSRDEFYKSFTVSLDGVDNDTIGAVFITINKYGASGFEAESNSSSNEVLFSRAVFDPIVLSSDSSYTLTYYIYF